MEILNFLNFHSWHKDTGKCKYCGVNKIYYERGEGYETYAFSLYNINQKIFNMKFDVIIESSLPNE